MVFLDTIVLSFFLLLDHMTIRLALMFGKVTVSDTNITFYDCRAVGKLNATSP